MDKIKKILTFEVKQIGEESDRVLEFVGSTGTRDHDGDILEINGWNLSVYNKNPIIMGFHQYDKFPYANSKKTYVDPKRKALIFEVRFPNIEELTSYPNNPEMIAEHAKNVDLAYNMYKNSYMRAVSVGFIGNESEPINEDGKYVGKRYKSQTLLELSLVPVPANFECLATAQAKGFLTDEDLKIFEENFEEVKTVITKPGWDETETSFRFRVRDPGLFQEGSFRTVPIKKDKPRVNSVMGRLKDETTLTVQSIIFPKEDDWDLAGAKAWLKEHEDLTKGVDDVENKSIETKKADLQGNPSAWDIMDAIRLAINPNGVYIGGGPYIGDLFPIKYPNGHVVIEKNEKCFLYQYEYKDGVATLSTDFMELEEIYKPRGYFVKSGATLSQKTKNMLGEICESMNNCSDKLRKFIENTGIDEPPDESGKTNDIDEMKQALAEIKSQVLILCEKTKKTDANEDINLDAIEFPKNEKNAANDELQIKPEELKQLIKELLKTN